MDSSTFRRFVRPVTDRIPTTRRASIKRGLARVLSCNLTLLAIIFDTDKGPRKHNYTIQYSRLLDLPRKDPLRILEIGVGGDEHGEGGASLRMWRYRYPNARVIGVDLFPKEVDDPKIVIVQGDQGDREFLEALGHREGPFDLVIDDGSHVGTDIIASFETLFPFVRPRG